MNRYTALVVSAVLAGGTAGCGKKNDPVDLGRHNPTSVGAELSDYAGVWHGYAEAYAFNDGSDAVRLTLDADGEGTIEVGESERLPPPDPEHNYPSNADTPVSTLFSGFAYPVREATVAAERIKFVTYGTELYREWCAALQPNEYRGYLGPWGGPGGAGAQTEGLPVNYSCWPLSGRRIERRADGCRDLDDEVEIPCGPSQCPTVCTCTETACSVVTEQDFADRGIAGPLVRFDGSLTEDGRLVGTLVFEIKSDVPGSGTRIALRLTRQ